MGDLSTDLQSKLTIALPCLPNKERQDQYTKRLLKQYPDHSKTIMKATACYAGKGDLKKNRQCVKDVLKNSGLEVPSPEPDEQRNSDLICHHIRARGEKKFKENQNAHLYEKEQLNYLDSKKNTLTKSGYAATRDIINFYFTRIKSKYRIYLHQLLNERPDLANRWQAYQNRAKKTQPLLNPTVPSDKKNWVGHYVKIDGIAYLLPVYVAKSIKTPWFYYDRILRSAFDVLKLFMKPKDLERLLHSPKGKYRDFSIRIADCNPNLKRPDGGWWYQDDRTLFIRKKDFKDFDLSNARDHFTRRTFLWTFYHEMGHAIESTFIDDGILDSFMTFWAWSQKLYYKKDRPFNIYHKSQYDPTGNSSTKNYGFKNTEEFFAEMVKEYFMKQIINTRPFSKFINQPFIMSGIQKARLTIMRNFFSPNGINPKALSIENISKTCKAFRDYEFPPTRQNLFPLSISFEYISQHCSINGSKQSSDMTTFGFWPGYISRPVSSGFFVGGGIGGSIGIEFSGNKNLKNYQVGSWGRFGYATWILDVYLEPAIGFSYLTAESFEQSSFWGGGKIGLFSFKAGVGLYGQAQVDHHMGYSFGGGFLLDFFLPIQRVL